MTRLILADSITTLPPVHRDHIVVCGSHGGAYPAAIAINAGLRAIVLNDAGGGLDGAGFASLEICNAVGMAACTADTMSCHIGDAGSMMARGKVSHANDVAKRLGVRIGMAVAEAVHLLAQASCPKISGTAEVHEARHETLLGSTRLVLVDSASLVTKEDAGAIVVTGSHGGLIGGDPSRALKADALFALYNDAGMGADGCGIMRLPALDQKAIAAACVAAFSARIGDAKSTLQDGVLSTINECAKRLGLRVGQKASEAVAHMAGTV